MKVTIIGGSDRGECAAAAEDLAERVIAAGGEANVWLLPAGITTFCDGCGLCFNGEESKCRHAREIMPIRKSMLASDAVAFVTPSVSGHAPAPVVNFFNYLEYMQIDRRPLPEMARKRFVIFSLGARRAGEDVADCVRLWGASDVRVLTYSAASGSRLLLSAPKRKLGFCARLRIKRLAQRSGTPLPPDFFG